MISKLAASRIFDCLQTISGCVPQHRKFRPLLTSNSPCPPPAVSTPRWQTQRIARRQRNVRLLSRFVSAVSSAAPLPSQTSVAPVPLSESLAPVLNPTQPCLPQTDRKSELSLHLAPLRKKARDFVPITSGAIVTRSNGGYRVANSIRDSSNSELTPPPAANCCIVACRGPQLQSSRDSRDELLVKKISARDSSNTLVAPSTAENEIAYSTHYCRFPSFERCAVKRFGTHLTVARALDILAANPLPCNITAPVHESCAKPVSTPVVCTCDSAAPCGAPRTELYSALDLTSTRPVSCAHRVVREDSLVTIAQVDTCATSRDTREYNSDRTPQSRHLILNSRVQFFIAVAFLDSSGAIISFRCLHCSIVSTLPRFSLPP